MKRGKQKYDNFLDERNYLIYNFPPTDVGTSGNDITCTQTHKEEITGNRHKTTIVTKMEKYSSMNLV